MVPLAGVPLAVRLAGMRYALLLLVALGCSQAPSPLPVPWSKDAAWGNDCRMKVQMSRRWHGCTRNKIRVVFHRHYDSYCYDQCVPPWWLT